VDRAGLIRALVLGVLLALTSACATSPISTSGKALRDLEPAQALDPDRIGQQVVWGGEIVEVINRSGSTELIVLSHPLDRQDRPRWRADPGHRFLLRVDGFVEPLHYAPGRFISCLGTIADHQPHRLENFTLELPVIVAEQLHLWPADPTAWNHSLRFSLGLSVGL